MVKNNKKEMSTFKIFLIGIAITVSSVFILALLAGGGYALYNMTQDDSFEEYISTFSSLDLTEDIIGKDGEASFDIEITLNNSDEPLILENFEFKVIYGKLFHSIPEFNGKEVADVLIKLPKMFFQDYATEENVPIIIASINRDPAFLRGEDYPEDFPIDRIEIIIREIVVYNENNIIKFTTSINVVEESDDYDINKLAVRQKG